MSDRLYFDTSSCIFQNKNNEPDMQRFIERISYESMSALDGRTDQYCEKLKIMIKNHVEIEEYEIAAGLKLTLDILQSNNS